MSRKFLYILSFFLPFVIIGNAQDQVIPLGKLDVFWRNHPVLGPFLQEGLWLVDIPVFLCDTDFPYKKRPYAKEVPFADHLSVVRLLGGTQSHPDVSLRVQKATDTGAIRKLSKYDFVFRKEDGTLGFRPELIEQRLSSYLENGYNDFTIVLDCVPWGLIRNPIIGSYGQAGPPDDPEEWYVTVRELCLTLKNILGEEKANKLRFRIGTEMNDTRRFAGTEDQFITHFDYAAAAITEVLPGARLSLYNINAVSMDNIKTEHNINAFTVLKHAVEEKNYKTGKFYGPLPFVAASRYYAETSDLDLIITGIDEVWDYVNDSLAGYQEKFTREIHEFGAQGNWSADPKTHNHDAFGNAMNLQVIMNLRAIGIDKLFHWMMLEEVVDAENNAFYIPSTQAWGFNILDHMAGGESYKVIPENRFSKDGTEFTSMLSVLDNKAYLLVTAFHPDRTHHDQNMVSLKLPKALLDYDINSARFAVSNNSNSIMYQLRYDLEKEGLLVDKVIDQPEYVADYRRMITDRTLANKLVIKNQEKYKAMWKSSLTLTDFEGQLIEKDGFYHLTFEMAAPESMVIELSRF